jgi:aminopeptidase N
VKKIVLISVIFFSHTLWAQNYFSKLIENEKKSFFSLNNAKSCALSSNYNVNYYCCYWNLNPAVDAISGIVAMHFKALSAMDSLQMDIAITMNIDSVYYHNSKVNFLQQTGDVLGVKFPSTIAANNFDSVKVYYHGFPGSTGFGSFKQGTHGNNIPVLWTLSEPYGAKEWWPCKQTLEDKADSIDVFITCPQGNKAASNGLLKQIIPQGANNIYHWKHKYPIATYLICAAVTNYSEYTDTVILSTGKLPVLYMTYPEDSVASRQTESQLHTVLRFYDSLFVPYPFMSEKYGQAQFGWGGGMEHQTMTFIVGYYIDLLAHELSHHWFGDHITCGSWADLWLNEGFAVYCTGISLGRLFGPSAFRNWQEQQVSNITSLPGGSVYVDDTTNVGRLFSGRLTYAKGAYLLQMLRWKLGDNAFFTAIRNYQNDPALSYTFARTNLLQQHFEATSGQNLNNFFSQWFYGQGYPSYLTIWNQDKNNQLKIILNQTTSHSSVPFYQMPVPIEVKGQGHDTILVFNHTYNGEIIYTNLNFKADTILFDPDIKILSASNKVINEFDYIRSQMNLVIYPNPATTYLNIEINDLSNYPNKIELYDMLGQKILEAYPNRNKISVDLIDFAQGTYFLKIISGNKATSHKIVIEKNN